MGLFTWSVASFTLFPSVIFISTAYRFESHEIDFKERIKLDAKQTALVNMKETTCNRIYLFPKEISLGNFKVKLTVNCKTPEAARILSSLVFCQWIIAKSMFNSNIRIIAIRQHQYWDNFQLVWLHTEYLTIANESRLIKPLVILLYITAALYCSNHTYTVGCWFHYKVSYLAQHMHIIQIFLIRYK